MKFEESEVKKVKRLTRFQVDKMTLRQLYIAAEFEKFQISDLIEQAKKLVTEKELELILNHINSFEDETGKNGSWHYRPPTVKW